VCKARDIVVERLEMSACRSRRNDMLKKAVLALALLGGSMLSAQVSIGIRIGPPPAPRVIRAHPVAPGPDYIWVDGYWYPVGGHYKWHEGYWSRPPYPGAVWVAPH